MFQDRRNIQLRIPKNKRVQPSSCSQKHQNLSFQLCVRKWLAVIG